MLDREKQIETLVQHILSAMDMDTLMQYAYDMLEKDYGTYTDEQLIAECIEVQCGIEDPDYDGFDRQAI
jgi:endonuclease III